jgi:hypothetical protein
VSAVARRRRRASGPRWLPSWRVTIAEHHLPPRWHVPARSVTLGAGSAEAACRFVVRWAHRDAGVPPLRSMIAVSMRYTRVERARMGVAA